MERRAFLIGAGVTVALAGCAGDNEDPEVSGDSDTDTEEDEQPTEATENNTETESEPKTESEPEIEEETEEPDPAKFEYSDLEISPSNPEPGQDIEVSVRVENTGNVQGSDTVKFDVDGTSFNDTVSVNPGESKVANISFITRSQKQYEVSVSGLTKSFETGYDWAEIGDPYEAPDGLVVTLSNFEIEEMAGSYEYTIDYKLENPTEDAIDEGLFKLYLSGGGGEGQTGFFGEVFPNEDVTRTYIFKAEKDVKFEVLAYHPDQFLSGTPPENSIKWPVEY